MVDQDEAQTPEEELTGLGPEDGILSTHVIRTAKLVEILFPDLKADDVEVYFDDEYIRIFLIGEETTTLIALLAYT
jgi:hypothetical protein